MPYAAAPAEGLAPAMLRERGAWMRGVIESGGGIAPEEFPIWQTELVHLQRFMQLTDLNTLLGAWEAWTRAFERAEGTLHWGTSNWVDSTLFATADAFMDRLDAPEEARATVDLMRAYNLRDWTLAAASANRLVGPVGSGEEWMSVRVLLDLAVIANLEVGRITEARNALEVLVPLTGRETWNVRNRLLDALVTQAENEGSG